MSTGAMRLSSESSTLSLGGMPWMRGLAIAIVLLGAGASDASVLLIQDDREVVYSQGVFGGGTIQPSTPFAAFSTTGGGLASQDSEVSIDHMSAIGEAEYAEPGNPQDGNQWGRSTFRIRFEVVEPNVMDVSGSRDGDSAWIGLYSVDQGGLFLWGAPCYYFFCQGTPFVERLVLDPGVYDIHAWVAPSDLSSPRDHFDLQVQFTDVSPLPSLTPVSLAALSALMTWLGARRAAFMSAHD